MRGACVSVCPECDAYLLMQECAWGIPFYSTRDCAVISIADRDRIWPCNLHEFGNLPFTRNALAGALRVLDEVSILPTRYAPMPLDRSLLGPTGIPDDESADAEWHRQLETIALDLLQRPVAFIDAAARLLIRQVPNEPNRAAASIRPTR